MTDRVLVTGAGGFIASHLVEALVAGGARVRALVRYNGRGDLGNLALCPRELRDAVELVRGDVSDPFFVRGAVEGCATVYHLAALIAIPYSYTAPRNVFDVNVMGTLHVAQACAATGAAMVHTSTSEVYGTAQTVPISETHPLVGQSPYAASKIGADQCVASFVRALGLRAVTVRPFNTYGPRQSARAIVPTIMAQALAGNVVRLGALHTTRDLNYVDDTVAGFVAAGAALDRIVGETINLGTGTEVSVGALAERIFTLLGRTTVIETDPARVRPKHSEVARLVADASRARALLGWSPRTTLDEGLARTLAFVREHLERYRPGEYAT
jgi:dTDP-glucose 4,6-dehydratase